MADNYETWLNSVNTRAILPYIQKPKAYLVIEDNDIGTPNVRNRSTAVNTFHQFKMRFDKEEWQVLKYWVQYNLANAALPFYFPHPETGQSVLMRFAVEEMNGNWFNNMSWTFDFVTIETIMQEV